MVKSQSEQQAINRNKSMVKNKAQANKANKTAEREKKPAQKETKSQPSSESIMNSKMVMAMKRATITRMLEDISKNLKQKVDGEIERSKL